MPLNIPQPQGDLARTLSSEPERDWPECIKIVAYWRGKKGPDRTKSIMISGDQFFGINTGAPLTGDQLIGMIERLRKSNGRT